MSLVVSIFFVLGLFAVVGLVAWAAVAYDMTRARGAQPRLTVLDTSRDDSREPVGQFVS